MFTDLNKCAHIDTALQLALFGNDALRISLLRVLQEQFVDDVNKVGAVVTALQK